MAPAAECLEAAIARARSIEPDATTKRIFSILSQEATWSAVSLSDIKRMSSKMAKAAAASQPTATPTAPATKSSSLSSPSKPPKKMVVELPVNVLTPSAIARFLALNCTNPTTESAVQAELGLHFATAMIFPDKPFLRTYGMQIAHDGITNLVTFIHADGVVSTIAAWRVHASDAKVSEGACRLVRAIGMNEAQVKEAGGQVRSVQAGAIPLLLQAIRTHPASNAIVEHATAALKNLCSEPGEDVMASQLMIREGALDVFLHIVEAAALPRDVLCHVLGAAGSVLAHRDLQLHFRTQPESLRGWFAAGARAMNMHAADALLQDKALYALLNVSSKSDFDAFTKAGIEAPVELCAAVQATVDALKSHASDVRVAFAAMMMLSNLMSTGVSIATVVATLCAKKHIRMAAKSHRSNLQVQNLADAVLHKLAAGASRWKEAAAERHKIFTDGQRATKMFDMSELVSPSDVAQNNEEQTISDINASTNDCIAENPQLVDEHAPNMVGKHVRICNLSSDISLNGRTGKVNGVEQMSGQLLVTLDGGECVRIPAIHLEAVAAASDDLKAYGGKEVLDLQLDHQLPECQPEFGLLQRSCSECGRLPPDNTKWSVCSRCNVNQYCCAEHQKQAWKHGGHKSFCGQPLPTLESLAAAADTRRCYQPYMDALRQFGRACPQLAVNCMVNVANRLDSNLDFAGEPHRRWHNAMQVLIEQPIYAQVIVEAMGAFCTLEGVQMAGLQVLMSLCEISAVAQQTMIDAGGIGAALAAMDNVSKQVVAETACIFLSNVLVDERVEMQPSFLAANGVRILCAAMQTYASCERLQEHACRVAFYMTAHDQEAKALFMEQGLHKILISVAVCRFGANAKVAAATCGCLRNLTVGKHSGVPLNRKQACAAAGAFPNVMRLIQQHPTDCYVQALGMSALVNLYTDDPAPAVSAAGGSRPLLKTILNALCVEVVDQEGALLALSALSVYTAARGRGRLDESMLRIAIEEDAIRLLCCLLDRFSASAFMAECVLGMLDGLLSDKSINPAARLALKRSGLWSTLLKAIRAYPCYQGKKLLFRFVHGDQEATAELATAMASMWDDDLERVEQWFQETIKALSTVTDPRGGLPKDP